MSERARTFITSFLSCGLTRIDRRTTRTYEIDSREHEIDNRNYEIDNQTYDKSSQTCVARRGDGLDLLVAADISVDLSMFSLRTMPKPLSALKP